MVKAPNPATDGTPPTDWTLERFVAGDLPTEEARALRERIASDPALKARVEGLRGGFAPDVDADAMFAQIRTRVGERAPTPEDAAHLLGQRATRPPARSPFWRRLLLVTGPLAIAAVALLMARPPSPSDPTDVVRAKGGLVLTVYRAVEGGAEVVHPGARLVPGDRLRFSVDVPRAGHLAVLGVDAARQVALLHPAGGEAAPRVEAARGVELPRAVSLDGTPGDEAIWAILCDAPFEPGSIAWNTNGHPDIPDGCAASSVGYTKGTDR